MALKVYCPFLVALATSVTPGAVKEEGQSEEGVVATPWFPDQMKVTLPPLAIVIGGYLLSSFQLEIVYEVSAGPGAGAGAGTGAADVAPCNSSLAVLLATRQRRAKVRTEPCNAIVLDL